MDPFFIHKPSSLEEFVGQDEAISKLENFFNNFSKGKALFLYGPPGTGKTSSIIAYAHQESYDLLELNASDHRNQTQLKEFLSKATGQASLFGTKKIILLDEVDGLSGLKDRGAANVIADFVKKSSFPIVITGSNVFDKKFSAIKKVSVLVEFETISAKNIFSLLERFVFKNSLEIDKESLKQIARHANGDARAALNDLFTLAIISESEVDDVSIRKKTISISKALIPIFKSRDPKIVFGSFDNVEEDLDKIFLWVDQNIPREYLDSKNLANAYEILSRADIFFGRIRRWQYYRFYVYCYLLLSVGIALAKDKKSSVIPNYSQPSRLLKYWQKNMQFAKRKSIIEKLASKTSISKNRALKDSFPFLIPVLSTDTKVQTELELSPDEISWLKKIAK